MKITIIGTGNLARAITTRALAGGHEVDLVGSHLSKARELADELIGEGSVDATEQLAGDPTNPVDLSVSSRSTRHAKVTRLVCDGGMRSIDAGRLARAR
jgi:predicted dinucleotide-binding enzyme